MIELERDECERILREAPTAYVACISDGEPYVTPMSFAYVEGDILFRTREGKRTEALAADPRVCVVVDLATPTGGWESVIAWGEATPADDHTAAEAIAALIRKYGGSGFEVSSDQRLPVERPVYRIRLSRMSGRSSGAGLGPETHPGRL